MQQYVLLKQKRGLSPRKCNVVSQEDFISICSKAMEGKGYVHVDFETNGLEAHHYPDIHIISIGMAAADIAPVAADVRNADSSLWIVFYMLLQKRGWVAYNMTFDGAHMYNYVRDLHHGKCLTVWEEQFLSSMKGCSLTLFRHLTNDGVKGMRHTLEVAIESYLGWKEGESQKTWLSAALKAHKLSKNNMWRLLELEPQQFLEYNAMDAEASFQIWENLVKDINARKWNAVGKWHMKEGMDQIRELIVQQHHGVLIDREKLAAHGNKLRMELLQAEGAFRAHPKVKPLVEQWEADAAKAFYTPVLVVKHIFAKKKDFEAGLLSPQPSNNNGEDEAEECRNVDSGWTYWPRENAAEDRTLTAWEREQGGRYYKRAVHVKVKNANKPAPKFNTNSPDQLRWLLFTGPNALFKWEIRDESWTDKSGRKVESFVGVIFVPGEDGDDVAVEIPLTKGGELPTGKDVAPALGEVGALLQHISKLEQELGYVDAYLAASERDNTIHPQFKPHGTATGRTSATGGINLTQLTKSQGFLECLIPRKGCKFVDFDCAALEPTVQAEFSRDKTMMELYASERTHDIYLFLARTMHPDPEFRKQLTQEYVAEPSIIEELKKKYKKARSMMKGPILSMGYKVGAKKLKRSLNVQGYPVQLEDTAFMKDSYWATFADVVSWAKKMEEERRARGGWLFNGMGHPLALPDNYSKDILNRFTQNTGHCILMMLNTIVRRKCLEAGLTCVIRPIIQDYHDERIMEVPDEYVDTYVDICNKAVVELNETLGGLIPIKISPDIGDNIWKFKS